MSLDVDRSEITGNRGSNLLAGAFNGLEELSIRVQRTDLSDAQGGVGIGLANVAFLDIGGTIRSAIDLGGGSLGSAGQNCITSGPLAANVVGYDVKAVRNWWAHLRARPSGGPWSPAASSTSSHR